MVARPPGGSGALVGRTSANASQAANRAALTRATRNIERAMRALTEEGVPEGLDLAGEVIVGEIQRLQSTPFPPASRPGEPPHRRTGELRDSWEHRVEGGDTLRIDSSAEHSRFMEFGTRYISPRPSVRPAVRSQGAKVTSKVAEAIDRAQRRAGYS